MCIRDSPKGAVSTHRAVCQAVACFECGSMAGAMANPETIGAMMQAGFEPCVMLAVPLFHVSGCYSIFLLALRAGRRIVMLYKWDVQKALELIQAERVTVLTAAPSMAMEMLESPLFERYDTSSLSSIGTGGAATPAKIGKLMLERVRNAFPGTGWGMTETCPLGVVATPTPSLAEAGEDAMDEAIWTRQGRLQFGIDLKIVDDDGADLPWDGEASGALLATTLQARGLYDYNPFSLGIAGGYARKIMRELGAKADLVVALGASLANVKRVGKVAQLAGGVKQQRHAVAHDLGHVQHVLGLALCVAVIPTVYFVGVVAQFVALQGEIRVRFLGRQHSVAVAHIGGGVGGQALARRRLIVL